MLAGFRQVALVVLLLSAMSPGSTSAIESAAPIDYAAAFARSFPAVAGEHRVADWGLYAALVNGDIVSYAARIDPLVAQQRGQAQGKGYQTQELEARIKLDHRLRASFDEQRHRVETMLMYADGSGDGAEACKPQLIYAGKEFHLIFGMSSADTDPLASATVAPSCPPTLDPGFQITAGHSPRFKCWAGIYGRACGWRLPDMPDELKRVVEDGYPTSIKLRWRWRGLGGTTRVRIRDSGSQVAEQGGIVVTTPLDLGLEFVDGKGEILWTAEGARVGGPASPRQRP